MRLLTLAIFAFLGVTAACSTGEVKIAPEYSGIDPKAQQIYDEFILLSAQNNIRFYNKVTIGFKPIKIEYVIGICNRGAFFREIDLDINFWLHNSPTARMAVLYHELAHCMCGRGHDYGEDLKYPETAMERLARALEWKAKGGDRPGYWDDGCPISLLYPVVVDNDCLLRHYHQYTVEMFDRCNPW